MSYKKKVNGLISETFKFTEDQELDLRYMGYHVNSATNAYLGYVGNEYRKVVLKVNLSSLKKFSNIKSATINIKVQNSYNIAPIKLTLETGFNGEPIYNNEFFNDFIGQFGLTDTGNLGVDVAKYLKGKECEDVYFGIISDDAYTVEVMSYGAPTIEVIYTEYEDNLAHQKSLTGSVGEKVSYGVDLRNGVLSIGKSLYKFDGCLNPMDLRLVYNSTNRNKNFGGLSNGWKFNYFQRVIIEENTATFLDSQGISHKFNLSNAAGKYYDTFGTGLLLTILENGTYQISDTVGNLLVFNSSGFLISIKNKAGANYLVTTLELDSSNRLTRIVDPMGNDVSINYISSTTIEMSCSNRPSIVLSMPTGMFLITEDGGRSTQFSYCENTSEFEHNQIEYIYYDNGEKTYFRYDKNNVIEVLDTIKKDQIETILDRKTLVYGLNETKVTNYSDVTVIYTFDCFDRLIGVTDSTELFENCSNYIIDDFSSAILRMNTRDRIVLKETEFSVSSYEYNVFNPPVLDGDVNRFDEILIPIPKYKELSVKENNLPFESDEEYLVLFKYKIEGAHKESTSYRETYLAAYQGDVEIGRVNFDLENYIFKTDSFVFKTIDSSIPTFKLVHVENIGLITISDVHIVKYAKNETKICFNFGELGVDVVEFEGVNYYPKTKAFSKFNYRDENYEGITVEANMYEDDMSENIKNYHLANGGRFDLWYNHKRDFISNVSDVCVFVDETDVRNLADYKMLVVTETNDKTIYEYEDYTNTSLSTDVLSTYNQKILYKGVLYNNQSVIDRNYLVIESSNYDGTRTLYEYNQYGNLLMETLGAEGTNLTISKTYNYSDDNKWLLSESSVGANGQTSTVAYVYNDKGLISKVTMPNGLAINYDYDSDSMKLVKLSSSALSTVSENHISYLKDLVSKVTHKDSSGYEFSYNKYNMMNSVRTNMNNTYDSFIEFDNNFVTKQIDTLDEEGNVIDSVEFADYDEIIIKYPQGYQEKSIKDLYGNVIKKQFSTNGTSFQTAKEYFYSPLKVDSIDDISDPNDELLKKNSSSKLRKSKDKIINNVTRYRYNSDGNICEITNTNEFYPESVEYQYSLDNRLSSMQVNCPNDIICTNYQYRNDGNYLSDEIEKVSIYHNNTSNNPSYTVEVLRDELNRMVEMNSNVNDIELTTSYTYPVSSNKTVEFPNAITISSSNASVSGSISYTYGNINNIAGISDTVCDNTISYTYDLFGRLTRENNQKLNKSVNYIYDDKGNITQKQEGTYTTKKLIPYTKAYIYTYDTTHPDRLISYDGQTISYDSNGNVTAFDGKTFTWSKGKQLTKVKLGNTNTYNYDYDGDGRRIRMRDLIGIEHKYIYDGDKIISKTVNHPLPSMCYKLTFIYSGNEVIGFVKDSSKYIFLKNLQHDIIGIVNEQGNVVARYVYDAWGNHVVYDGNTINTNENFIGNINPFRYRGYYYDVETGLFMVGHRYYNPEWGRWLSPDDIEYLDPHSINGLNLYAYCNNDPVNKYDPTGHFAISIAFLVGSILIGAAVGAGISGVSAYAEGERGWDLAWDIVGGAVFGAAIGATVALGGAAGLGAVAGSAVTGVNISMGAALGISIGGTAFASATKYSLDCAASSREWNLGGYFVEALQGAAQGAATFGLAYLGGKAGLFNKIGNFNSWDAFYTGFGGMNNLKMIGYMSNLIMGPGLSKLLLISGLGAGVRWIINKMIPEL